MKTTGYGVINIIWNVQINEFQKSIFERKQNETNNYRLLRKKRRQNVP